MASAGPGRAAMPPGSAFAPPASASQGYEQAEGLALPSFRPLTVHGLCIAFLSLLTSTVLPLNRVCRSKWMYVRMCVSEFAHVCVDLMWI